MPTEDLPLQEILVFEPCPPELSISYLQGLCLAENRLIDRNSLLGIVASSAHHVDAMDTPDMPLNPLTSWEPTLDLRKAIHHLQLVSSTLCAREVFALPLQDQYIEELCDWIPTQIQSHAPASATELQKQLQALRALSSHTDTISFADSYLTRHALHTPDVSIFIQNHRIITYSCLTHVFLLDSCIQ